MRYGNPRRFSVGRIRAPRYRPKSRIGEPVLKAVVPDRAEVSVGGPPPLPRGKLVWDREKKARIAILNRRLTL